MRLPLLFLAFSSVHSYHVLFVHTFGTTSHLIVMKGLMEELLERGNSVTAIIFKSIKLSHENYTEIVIPSIMEKAMEEGSKKVLEKGGGNPMSPSLWWWAYNFYKSKMKDMALDVVRTEPVLKLIRDRPKVDVMINMMPANAFFAEIFDCPIITFSPAGPMSILMKGTTNVINNSIQPFITAPFIEPMTFLNRLQNQALIAISSLFIDWQAGSMFTQQQEFLQEELGVEITDPSVTNERRVALLIAGSHPVTHGAWQYLPNVIEAGGLQLQTAKALPTDLQNFMDSATEGAVLVSFGSSLKPHQMPPEKIQMFVDTFKLLPAGMKVIWKWDAELPGLPDNVMLSSWLPQQDLLAHPNLKVFVTHGGLGGVQEAIYHKAVLVGLPLSNDQKPNILRAVRHGYAILLNYDEITAEELVSGITKAMADKEMLASLERVHTIFMDREEPARVLAAWWVEYVCRHGGADWLKSIGADVPFYQRHHLDLILLIGLVLLATAASTFLFWRAVFRCCCGRKAKID